MEVIHLESWEKFLSLIPEVDADYSRLKADPRSLSVSEMLWRGQQDAEWTLSTTLERQVPSCTRAVEYLRIIRAAKPMVETFTSLAWELPSDIEEQFLGHMPFGKPVVLYEYMAFLRHHGFPSPLLDWTGSPFVAAYFAYSSPPTRHDQRVAVFSYQEYAGSGKGYDTALPHILTVGPTIKAHRRHFLQQSQYTFCGHYTERSFEFAPHDSVPPHDPPQDVVRKYTLPMSDRTAALSYLRRHNITALSLFENVESLMATVAHEVFRTHS